MQCSIIINMRKYFSNNKYKIFLFLPIAFFAIFYLISATDASYLLNAPLIMTPIQATVNMRTAGRFINRTKKVYTVHFYKLMHRAQVSRNLSYFVCLECRNIPISYKNNILTNYKFSTYISFVQPLYYNRIIRNIFHPPKSVFA